MSDIARWVDRCAEAEVTEVFEALADDDPGEAWSATAAREGRAKDSVYGVLRGTAPSPGHESSRISARRRRNRRDSGRRRFR